MPTPIATYYLDSAGDNTNTLTTPSFTPSAGEVITVQGVTWATGETLNTPSGGSLAFPQLAVANFGGFSGYCSIWGDTVISSPGSMTVSVAPAVSSRHDIVVIRWANARLAGSPVNASNWYNGSAGTPSLSLTTSAANSAVIFCNEDAQSVSPASRAYLPAGTTEDGLFDGSGGANGVFYFAHATIAGAGPTTVGMSAPGGQKWAAAAVEILDNPPSSATVILLGPGRVSPSGWFTPWLGTGSDISSQAVALADVGTGAETATVTATAPLADTGSGTDAAVITATAPLGDAGSAADALAVAVAIPLAEAGAGADATAETTTTPLTDTGSVADTIAAGVPVALAETGTAADTLTVLVTLAQGDAGSALDALAVAGTVPLTQSCSASDAISVNQGGSTPKALAEVGAARDRIHVLCALPASGTTARPNVGTTSRPDTGITYYQ